MLGLGTSLSNIYVPRGLAAYVNEYSVLLDGSNDFIDTGVTFESTFQNSFTISLWIKTPSSVNYKYFFGMRGNSTNMILPRWVSTGYGGSNFGITFEANNTGYTARTSDLPEDDWVHIVFTAQKQGTGSDPTLFHIYIDGSEDNQNSQNTGLTAAKHGAFSASSTNFAIGKTNGLGGETPGSFYQFAIFDTNVSAANAAAMYNGGSPIDLTSNQGDYDKSGNLVSFYKMDEGTDVTAADSAGSNNATLTNGPTWAEDVPS
jgi:hypothetical protein